MKLETRNEKGQVSSFAFLTDHSFSRCDGLHTKCDKKLVFEFIDVLLSIFNPSYIYNDIKY